MATCCCSGEKLSVEEQKPVTKKINKKTRKQIKKLQQRKEFLDQTPPEPVRYGGVLLSYDRSTAGRRGPGRSLNDRGDLAIDFYNKTTGWTDYRLVNVMRASLRRSGVFTSWVIIFTAKLPHQAAADAVTFQTKIDEDMDNTTVVFVSMLDYDDPTASSSPDTTLQP